MDVCERADGDLLELRRLAKREKDVLRRDRVRAVIAAIRGDDAPTIARVLGRSRRQVQSWVYAYRDGGIEALHPPARAGRAPKVRGEVAQKFRERLDAGPTTDDKVCTLRGKDVQRILREEFGVDLSLNATFQTLHREGYSCLSPRPRHEKQDLQKQQEFKDAAPLLCSA